MKPVFISYSSAEYKEAKVIANRVREAGFDYWMAPECIEGGKSYAQQIPQAIHEAKVILVVLSKKAMDSKWVAREVDRAINENKRVMPFLIEDAPMTDEFTFYLTNVQNYRGYLDFEAELSRMLADMKSFIGEPESSASAAEPAPAPEAEPAPKPAVKKVLSSDVHLDKVELFRLSDNEYTQKKRKKQKTMNVVKIVLTALLALWILLAVLLYLESRYPALLIPPIVYGAVLLFIYVPRRRTVAGKKYWSSAKKIEMTDPAMNAKDVEALGKFNGLKELSIRGGAIIADDLIPMIGVSLESLDIEGTQMSEAGRRSLEPR